MKVATPPAWWRAKHERTIRERAFVGDVPGHRRRRVRVAVRWPGKWRYVTPGELPRA